MNYKLPYCFYMTVVTKMTTAAKKHGPLKNGGQETDK